MYHFKQVYTCKNENCNVSPSFRLKVSLNTDVISSVTCIGVHDVCIIIRPINPLLAKESRSGPRGTSIVASPLFIIQTISFVTVRFLPLADRTLLLCRLP